jgi:protein regulator of cytokinesis 1
VFYPENAMNEMSNTRADMKAGLFKCVESGLHRIENIWKAIGFGEELRCERMKDVFQHTQELFSGMCEEEETLKVELKQKAASYREEATILFTELGMEPDLPEEGTMTLIDMEECLRTKLDSLDKEKYRRIKSYKQLKEAEESLCETLGLEPGEDRAATPPGIPHISFLDQLKERVGNLEQERERRFAAYCTVQESILQLWKDLEKEPLSDFELSIASRGADSFLLSVDNLEKVNSICQELRKEFDNLEHTATALKDQVMSMWQRLGVPQEERICFTKANEGCKPKVIKQWRKELERLEELKRQNMRSFIEATREELKKQWDTCMFGPEQRQEFCLMDTDECNDDVLEAHEHEVQRLKQLYASNAEIYKAIEKRQSLWARYLELEKNASDPDKFKNRGGKLLREQNEKKMLSKELPKLEKELKSLILAWENEHQQHFIIQDNRYLDVIATDWKQLKAGRELEKQERQKLKELQMAEETMFGSKPATTPLKRKVAGTPLSSNSASKRPRLIGTPSVVHSSLRSPQVRSKRKAAVIASVRMAGPRTPKGKQWTAAGTRSVKRKILKEQNVNESIQKYAKGDVSLASHGSYTDFTVR